MTQKKRLIIGLAAFVVMIAVAAFGYGALQDNVSPEILLAEQPGTISAPEGDGSSTESKKIKAPDFTVQDASGNSVKLSEMEGKPLVLNFWASWCPPCKKEMPDFDHVYAELGDEVNFMMVNLTDGRRETKEKALEYITQQEFSFPVYYDVDRNAAYTYGVRSIPTTIFIDSEGYLVTGAEGTIAEEVLRYGISLIQKK